MKKVLFIFLIFVTSRVSCSHAQSVHSLSDSSITVQYIRPADWLADNIQWNRATTDFFTYWVDSGFYGFYGPQPRILLDGMPIDANYFGWQDLNMLPISKPQTVEYSPEPGIDAGTVAPAGFINFMHAPVDTGISVNTSMYAGNETGDPGPYNYDSLKATPNIDRWGPDGELSLSYRKDKWYSKGIFVFRNHFPTDLAMNSRLHFTSSLLGTNDRYVNHRLYIATRSGLFETGYDASNWQARARTVFGVSKDYLFLQPFGREIPAKTGYQQIALAGSYHTKHWEFKGRYIGHHKTIHKRFELHSYIFDWDQHKHMIDLSANYTSKFLNFKPGFTVERYITHAPGIRDRTNNLATFFLNASWPISSDNLINVQINADYDNKQLAKTLGFSFLQKITKDWKVTPSLTYTEVLPIRQNSFSYWVNRGYTFADALGIPYSNSVAVDKNRLTILKLINTIKIARRLSLTLKQQLLRHNTLNVPYQQVEANEFITDTQPGTFTMTPENGTRLTLFSEIAYSVNKIFKQSLAVNIQRSLSGTSRYKIYFDQIPNTKIQYNIDVSPTPDLLLSLNILYRSPTRWKEFEAIEGNQYHLPSGIPIRDVRGTFRTQTPAFTDVSLALKKWLWDRRLSTQFSIRNLLNEEVRMHPIGAQLATKFDIRISLDF